MRFAETSFIAQDPSACRFVLAARFRSYSTQLSRFARGTALSLTKPWETAKLLEVAWAVKKEAPVLCGYSDSIELLRTEGRKAERYARADGKPEFPVGHDLSTWK